MDAVAATIAAPVGDKRVQAFCLSIVPGQEPIQVECLPLLGEPMAECFSIVPKHVLARGGRQLTGWAIWEWQGVLLEAEFHAVWQRDDGRVFDLTPRPIFIDPITFLPDPARQYQGRQVDNIRLPLSQDRDVTRFIFLAGRCFDILNHGDLADQHGSIALPKKAHRELVKLRKEMHQLGHRLTKRHSA